MIADFEKRLAINVAKKSLIVLCCLFSSTAFAERWFEVEVLVFKQRPALYLQEDFSLKHEPIKAKNTLELLTLYTQSKLCRHV
ncbi:CsiV family protein [Pseudoalteromonas sp. Hal099]